VRSVLHIPLVLRTLRNLTVRHLLSLVISRAQQTPPARLPAPPPAGVSERESVLAAALTLISVRARFASGQRAARRPRVRVRGHERNGEKEYVSPLWPLKVAYPQMEAATDGR
jgi:hypothetical protein